MTTQPEALRLARELEACPSINYKDHAAELRRLHALTERTLTDEIIAELWYKNGTYYHHFARALERWLKGQD